MKTSIMQYRGYAALIEYSADDECLVGHLLGISDIVGFHGDSVDGMRRELKVAVDEYIKACEKAGKAPNRPGSGKMLLRMPVELHARLLAASEVTGQSANQLVVELLSAAYLGDQTAPAKAKAETARPTRRRRESKTSVKV